MTVWAVAAGIGALCVGLIVALYWPAISRAQRDES